MNRKERQKEQITEHGLRLKRVFGIGPEGLGPVDLCKHLHRIEANAHAWAAKLCNGEIDPTEAEQTRHTNAALNAVDKLLGFRAKGIPVFINMDPRGHTLKVEEEYMRVHQLDLPRDWGGYGILCPEFDGKE